MKKRLRNMLVFILISMMLCGCGIKNMKIVPTLGLGRKELMRMDDQILKTSQVKVILMTEVLRYKSLYGENIFLQSYEEQSLEDSIKNQVLLLCEKIMVIDKIAEKYQVRLEESEIQASMDAAQEYMQMLSDEEKAFLKLEEKDLEELIQKIRIADKTFQMFSDEADIEISDDEARIVLIKHLMVQKNDNPQEAYSRILQIFDQISQGIDFDTLIEKYNEDIMSEYAVARGEWDKNLEEVIFSMDTGEISTVVESNDGYHIILCTDNFDREATDRQKKTMMYEKRWEAFEEKYMEFRSDMVPQMRESEWEKLSCMDEQISCFAFYDIYQKYFQE